MYFENNRLTRFEKKAKTWQIMWSEIYTYSLNLYFKQLNRKPQKHAMQPQDTLNK